MVVLDIKAELYCVTAEHRRKKFGHKIVCISPWADQLSDELEQEMPDHGGNLLQILRDDDLVRVKENAELIATLLIPGTPQARESEKYWQEAGRDLLMGLMLYMIEKDIPLNLVELRRLLMTPANRIPQLFGEMASSIFCEGTVSEIGSRMASVLVNSSREYSALMSTAQIAMRPFSPGGALGKHVARDAQVDFADLKDTPTTVYIQIPSDRLTANHSWLSLVLGLAFETVGKDRTNRRVRFLLDEMATSGYLPCIQRAMGLYRGQGVLVVNIVQSLQQLVRHYGEEGKLEIVGMSSLIQTFSLWDPQSAQMFSDMIGPETVQDMSYAGAPSFMESTPGSLNTTMSSTGRPLMGPDAIRTLPKSLQLVLIENLPPLICDKVNYLFDRKMKSQAAPNPYHRKAKKKSHT